MMTDDCCCRASPPSRAPHGPARPPLHPSIPLGASASSSTAEPNFGVGGYDPRCDRLDLALPDPALRPRRPAPDLRDLRAPVADRRREVREADRPGSPEGPAARTRDEEGVAGRARTPEPGACERDQEARALWSYARSAARAGCDEQH